jgi:hypothetical protein
MDAELQELHQTAVAVEASNGELAGTKLQASSYGQIRCGTSRASFPAMTSCNTGGGGGGGPATAQQGGHRKQGGGCCSSCGPVAWVHLPGPIRNKRFPLLSGDSVSFDI